MGVGTDHGKLAPMLNRRRLLAGISGAALTTGLTLRAVRGEAAVALRLGEVAPSATLLTLEERRLSTGDMLGRVVILTFWATWCAPCREELPLLSAYAERHAADGLEVLGFSLDSPDKLAEVRARASALSFPVGLLLRSDAAGYGRMWRIPVNFTIDAQGRLADDGWRDKTPSWTEERLERIVTPLLTRTVAPASVPQNL